MMRVLVCGGRDYFNGDMIAHALSQLPADAILVHGAAPGADSVCAHWWYDIQGRTVDPHPANWKKYGKAAGPIRNQEMLDSGVDLVVAFPGHQGTADMVRRAKKAGVEVIEYGG